MAQTSKFPKFSSSQHYKWLKIVLVAFLLLLIALALKRSEGRGQFGGNNIRYQRELSYCEALERARSKYECTTDTTAGGSDNLVTAKDIIAKQTSETKSNGERLIRQLRESRIQTCATERMEKPEESDSEKALEIENISEGGKAEKIKECNEMATMTSGIGSTNTWDRDRAYEGAMKRCLARCGIQY